MSYEATEIRPGFIRRIPQRWKSATVIAIVAASMSVWAIQAPRVEGVVADSAAMSAATQRWTGLAEFHQEQAAVEATERARAAETQRLTRHAASITGQGLNQAQAAYAARMQATTDALSPEG